MAYPQYGQMEPGGDTGLLPTPGDASYQPTGAAAYPPPPAYEQHIHVHTHTHIHAHIHMHTHTQEVRPVPMTDGWWV